MTNMLKLAVLVILPCLSLLSQTLRFTILSNGATAGSEVGTFSADRHVTCAFEFNDRGRGPKISADYILGPDGTPRHTEITGVDYLKAPVNEHFSAENGSSEGKSTAENGRGTGAGFYISMNGPNAEMAFLAMALRQPRTAASACSLRAKLIWTV